MDGPIKIGCSMSPTGRRDTLATWSPFPLEIIAELDGELELERRFHYHFSQAHNSREWFTATPELLETVAAINAGTFDPSTLIDRRIKGSDWRARKPPAEYVGKQVSLTRRAGLTEYESGFKCPARYYRAYEEGRHTDILLIERFIAEPAKYGLPVEENQSAISYRWMPA